MQIVAAQQDKELCEQFAIDVSTYESHVLIFVDETGSDCQNNMKRYGYGLREKPPCSCELLVRGERISVISAMKIIRGAVNGDEFLEFIERELLPTLLPFDGKNPNSIVILDNCAVHHVAGVASMITEVGTLVHFLPPYSPDFNPIEECFSKVKSILKSMETTHQNDLETDILAAFSSITSDDCQGWISDSGIYKGSI